MIKDTGNPYNSPVNMLRDILIKQLPIAEDKVNIYNAKWVIPKTEGWFISLSYVAGKVISNRAENVYEGSKYKSVQLLNVQELWDINVFSRNTEALFRKEEVIMALVSQYSQQVQEKYNFTLGRIPNNFSDLSELEGAAQLYRFGINIAVLAWYKKEKTADYYDTFTGKIFIDSETLPPVEFEQQTQES